MDTIVDPPIEGERTTWSTRRDLPLLLAFIVVVVGVGLGAASISFAAAGGNPAGAAHLTRPALWPPDPVFWMVWLVIYPCSAVAAWTVWRRRHTADVRGALVAFALINISAALFLPISSLVASNPAVLALMDYNGVIGVYLLAWLFSRYSKVAALWLLPYLIWMPLTAALKTWLWMLN